MTEIRLFIAEVGYRGVTDHALKEALTGHAWPDYSTITYIAPTPRKLRDARRRFHHLVDSPYFPPRFVTLKQMAKALSVYEPGSSIFPEMLIPLLISEISQHALGYASILAGILKELKQHYPTENLRAIHQALRDTFGRSGLPEDMLASLDRTFAIFAQYQENLSAAGYADEDDLLIRSSEAARQLARRFPLLVVDGFYDMTNAELRLLEGLLQRADKVLMTFPFALPPDPGNPAPQITGYLDRLRKTFPLQEELLTGGAETDLSYIKYAGIEDEVEGIARHIKNLYIAGAIHPSDSVILTAPQLSAYRQLFARVLTRYGLPFSMNRQQSYAQKPALRDLLSLLEAVADDFPRQKFTTFLNSPHFSSIPALVTRWSPALSLRSGIIKGREAWDTISPDVVDKKILTPFIQGLQQIFRQLAPLTALRNGATPRTFSACLLTLMRDLGFTADDDLRKQLEDACALLTRLPEVAGCSTLTLSRYAEFLRHLLNTPAYTGETEGIQIMEFPETRGLEPDHLYFCGLRDGEMPTKPPVDHVLPDSVRREAGLTDLSTYLHTQKVYFLRTTAAAVHRHLSYPSMEGDKVFLQSPYLPWGKERQEKVAGILSREELQVRRGHRAFETLITETSPDARSVARIRKGRLAMPLRVTDVDAFRKCPRRFYLEKILGLEASRIAEYGIEARVLGTLFHVVMEGLFSDPPASGSTLYDKACGIFDAAVRRYHLEPYWTKLLKASFLEVLPQIINLEAGLREEGFSPFRLEMPIENEELLPGISLKGKIDRIDTDDAGFRIIDYKTGTAEIGSAVIRTGKDLQLPLYAALLRQRGMEVRKAGLYSLQNIGIKWIPTSRDRHTLDDYIDSSLVYLQETVSSMQTGSFLASPLEEFFCASCAEVPYCPYINVAGSSFRSGAVPPAGVNHD